MINPIKYWHIENKDLIKDAEDSSDNELTYDVILNLDWECCELLARIQELERQLAESVSNKKSEWNRYSAGMVLDYPENMNCRRFLLLSDEPNCGIYDFVVSAHQDFNGCFWVGVPGDWVFINSNWIIKAWQHAPVPRAEVRTKESGV